MSKITWAIFLSQDDFGFRASSRDPEGTWVNKENLDKDLNINKIPQQIKEKFLKIRDEVKNQSKGN